jgi:hypothetical protein
MADIATSAFEQGFRGLEVVGMPGVEDSYLLSL